MAEDPWLTQEQRTIARLEARVSELEGDFEALVVVVSEMIAEIREADEETRRREVEQSFNEFMERNKPPM